MKSIRQSTLAALIAVVSTAALGPGIFNAEGPVTGAGRLPLPLATHEGAPLLDLQALTGLTQAGQAAGGLAAVLLDELPEQPAFQGVDFGQAVGGAMVMAGGQAHYPGRPGGEGAYAGNGYWAGTAMGSASTGNERSSGQSAQFAGNTGLPGNMDGPLSGFRASPAPEDSSAISLDAIALVDPAIQQFPLLALAPTPGELDGTGQGGTGANAVPEPATAFLMGLGLMGLLAARRTRQAPASPAVSA